MSEAFRRLVWVAGICCEVARDLWEDVCGEGHCCRLVLFKAGGNAKIVRRGGGLSVCGRSWDFKSTCDGLRRAARI